MKKIVCIFFILTLFFQLPVYAEDAEYVYTASIDGVCSLYLTPSAESYELMKVPACSELELLETEGTWNLVKYKNNVGWINSCYIRSTFSKAAMATGLDDKKTLQVDTGKNAAKMYPKPLIPGENNQGDGVKLPDGTILEMLRKTPSGWGLVEAGDSYMWIDTAYTRVYEGKVDQKQYGPYYVYVCSSEGDGVDLWKSPQTSESLIVIPECTQLIAREENGNYIYVSYKGMNGWIKKSCAEESLFNAQMKTGDTVMKECVVESSQYWGDTDLLSAPSYDEDVAASVLGTVDDGEDVFVLRTTYDGWSLVLADEILGWIQSENLLENPMPEEAVSFTVCENPQTGFVSTSEGTGLVLVSNPLDGVETDVIPETVSVEIIAEKDGYKYVRCEFGAGWAENAEIVSDYETSLMTYTGSYGEYMIGEDTFLMSVPSEKGSYGSRELATVKEGVKVTPLKIVEISGNEWALVKIGDKTGWINLSYMDSAEFPIAEVICVALGISFVLLVWAVMIKRKKNNSGKRTQEEDADTENEIPSEKEEKCAQESKNV